LHNGRKSLLFLDDQAVSILRQGLPLIGEEFSEEIDRMAHDTLEHIIKVLPGIDLACFA